MTCTSPKTELSCLRGKACRWNSLSDRRAAKNTNVECQRDITLACLPSLVPAPHVLQGRHGPPSARIYPLGGWASNQIREAKRVSRPIERRLRQVEPRVGIGNGHAVIVLATGDERPAIIFCPSRSGSSRRRHAGPGFSRCQVGAGKSIGA